MSIVSNTGPLIALAKIDQIGLLRVLFDQVLIGPLVIANYSQNRGQKRIGLT